MLTPTHSCNIGELIKSEPTPSAVDSRFGPKNLIEAAIHWHPYPTPHPSVFLDMISQDAGPECVGTPIESASSVRDVVIVNSDRILPVEGEECCASADDKKNDATILTMPTSLKEDRDIYCCDGERKKGERKDASVMSIREEHCAREDDKKNDLRVFLTTAPSLFGGEMKLGERNDAAFMTTLMHGDIGNEENQKHHLSVDQVQCAKRFCTRTECGETHIELIANVRDVVSINIGRILPNIEEEKHCITKIDGEIDATVIAAVRKSFQEVSDGLKSDHSTKSCSEPLCIEIDDETVTNIIQFAASTMGDVYVLSQTCKQWNEILNKIPNTANPTWYKIARRYYIGREFRCIKHVVPHRNDGISRDFRHLKIIDSGCKHDRNTEWRRLLYIERASNLKIFDGEMGPFLKRLLWVFRSEHILPFKNMSWKDGLVDCKMPTEEYWFILWGVNYYSRYHGIDRFDVDVSDESILTNFKDMCFLVHYLDHDYTTANFDSECRIIHRWLHVFGFHHYDYTIGSPIPADLSGPMRGYDGHIMVTLIDRYHNSEGQRVLCLGSMTIKNDRPNNHIPTTENEGWMELSADNGKPIEAQRIFYS